MQTGKIKYCVFNLTSTNSFSVTRATDTKAKMPSGKIQGNTISYNIDMNTEDATQLAEMIAQLDVIELDIILSESFNVNNPEHSKFLSFLCSKGNVPLNVVYDSNIEAAVIFGISNQYFNSAMCDTARYDALVKSREKQSITEQDEAAQALSESLIKRKFQFLQGYAGKGTALSAAGGGLVATAASGTTIGILYDPENASLNAGECAAIVIAAAIVGSVISGILPQLYLRYVKAQFKKEFPQSKL